MNFLQFLKENKIDPIVVKKTDSGKFGIMLQKMWFKNPEFDEWVGFVEYGDNFGDTMLMLEQIYNNHEIKIM